MKINFCLLLIFLHSLNTLGQCDLLRKASEEFCSENYSSSIKTLQEFKNNFPQSNINSNINLQIGYLYLLNKNYVKSEKYLKQLLIDDLSINSKNTKVDCGFHSQYIDLGSKEYDEREACILGNGMVLEDEPYDFNETEKYILLYLSDLYKETNQLKKSLQYLDKWSNYPRVFRHSLSHKTHSFQKAIKYGELYYKMNDLRKALKELLSVSLNINYDYDVDSSIVKLSYQILEEYSSLENLKKGMMLALDNIVPIEEVSENGIILINYYTILLDIKVKVYSHLKDANEHSKKEISNKLKNCGLYKTIFN